jgi:hypothetical protein
MGSAFLFFWRTGKACDENVDKGRGEEFDPSM